MKEWERGEHFSSQRKKGGDGVGEIESEGVRGRGWGEGPQHKLRLI